MIKMFKRKKRGQLSLGQDIRIQLDSDDMVTFFKDKETEKTIKDYEYLLNEKQFTLDGYVPVSRYCVNLQRQTRFRLLRL